MNQDVLWSTIGAFLGVVFVGWIVKNWLTNYFIMRHFLKASAESGLTRRYTDIAKSGVCTQEELREIYPVLRRATTLFPGPLERYMYVEHRSAPQKIERDDILNAVAELCESFEIGVCERLGVQVNLVYVDRVCNAANEF